MMKEVMDNNVSEVEREVPGALSDVASCFASYPSQRAEDVPLHR